MKEHVVYVWGCRSPLGPLRGGDNEPTGPLGEWSGLPVAVNNGWRDANARPNGDQSAKTSEPLEKVVNSKGTTWKYPKQFNASRDLMWRFQGQRDNPKWGNVPIHPRIALPLLAGRVMSTWKWFVPTSTEWLLLVLHPRIDYYLPKLFLWSEDLWLDLRKTWTPRVLPSVSLNTTFGNPKPQCERVAWTQQLGSFSWISPPLPRFFCISPWTTIYVGYCRMMYSFIVIIHIGSCGSQVLTPWKTTPSLTANTCVAVALQHNGSSWHIAPCGTPLCLRVTSNGGRCCGDVRHVSSVRKTEYIHDSPCHHGMTWCQPI